MSYMTPEDATQRLCPIMSSPDGARACVGPSCMSWIWDTRIWRDVKDGEVVEPFYGYCHLTQPAPK